MNQNINIKNFNKQELKEYIKSIGEKEFRAVQIFKWLNKGIYDFDSMTNISKDLREKLKKNTYIGKLEIIKKAVSKIDGTQKYLLLLEDNNIIECVLMRYKHGNSICISSQVGCRMGCKFCASTINGVIRNITAAEMIDQILTVQDDINERISNVVIMGSGEPFDNYDEVLKFLDIVNDEDGLNISMRNITISTCGLVPNIIDFAHKKLQVTLAISLHAPNDEIRNKIIPINKKYPIDELINSCKEYIKITNKRITFEYALINGLNDTKECAEELAQKIKNLLCHVNLIPLNKVSELEYTTPKNNKVFRFKEVLQKNRIQTTIRRELGSDIEAACGQLRRSYINNKNI